MLWAVTCHFNPMGYRRRLENYREFRRRLGVPLLAVELSFGGDFELTRDDADILVQLEGGGIMWQKERLLDIGVRRLPEACSSVACLDCDVFFERPDWARELGGMLERHPVVQPFSSVHHLRRDWSPRVETQTCIEYAQPAIAAVPDPASHLADATRREGGSVAAGHAWAYRRDVLSRHGLFDACIVGGGDTAMACAAWGRMDTVVELHFMNERQEGYYRAWAGPFHETIQASVGVLEGTLSHMWHGRVPDRRTRERHLILARHGFDPRRDIRCDPSGPWRWSSDKPALHDEVGDYFTGRKEDG